MLCFERRNEVEDKPASSERGKIKMEPTKKQTFLIAQKIISGLKKIKTSDDRNCAERRTASPSKEGKFPLHYDVKAETK